MHASTRGDIELQENYDRQIFDELEVIVVRDRQRILLPTPGLLTRVAGTLHAHSIKSVVFGASVPLGLLAPALRKRGVQKMVAITHGHEVWWSNCHFSLTCCEQLGETLTTSPILDRLRKEQLVAP